MRKSNVLLITVDSLRSDHLSLYGYDRETAPFLTSLAKDGVVCAEAIANAPNTPSSFPTILTSTHPQMYGGYDYLSEDRPFLAEELRQIGYETLGFHSNPHLGANHNYNNGFDRFEDSAEGSDSVATLKDGIERRLSDDSVLYKILRRMWHYFTLSTETSAYAQAETISDKAIDWIMDERTSPFFMWLHYMDVHYPFTPDKESLSALEVEPLSKRRVTNLNAQMQERPEELTEKDINDLQKLYDGEIRYTDTQIRMVVDALKQQGVLKNTIIIVTADHGEAFGEHGRFGHHPELYEELLKVPLIIHGPGIQPRRVSQQVSLIDLGPTVYDLVGADVPREVQGTSFEQLLNGEEMDEPVAVITAARDDRLACRTSEWKFFWRVDENQMELYNLTTDPEEQTDVSDEYPDRVREFKHRLERYKQKIKQTNRDIPEISAEEVDTQRLKDLGYVE